MTITLISSIILIGLWFLIQLFSEVGAVVQKEAGGIAYIAHVGGFVFGMASARLFKPRHRPAKRGSKYG